MGKNIKAKSTGRDNENIPLVFALAPVVIAVIFKVFFVGLP